MVQCKLTIYDGEDFLGDKASFTSSKKLHTSEDMFDRDASGRMTGDCQNTSFLGFEHWTNHDNGGLAWIMGEGDNVRSFVDGNSHGKGKCSNRDHRWYKRHDQVGDIVKITIPTENIKEGRMREDITIYGKRYDTRNCQWGHIPNIRRTDDGQYSANDSDQWLTGQDKKGQPCPGGRAYWKGFQKVSCVYDLKSGPKLGRLKTLHGEIKNSFSGDPRKAMYTNIVNRYCNSGERLNDVISSDTSNNKCRDVVDSTKLAKEYCKLGDKIATDSTFCTKKELGENNYNELAEKYCENNPDKDFCACFNVMQPGLCDQLPDIPGCKTVKPIWDGIISSLDEGDIAQFEGMQPCYASVCTGPVYQPTSWDANCNRDISICKADFDIGGNLVGSNITLKQDCGNNESEGGGGGGTTTTTTNGEEKSLTEKFFKFEEDKDKKLVEKQSTKIFGTVSSVSSCFMCMAALILFT